MVSALGASSGGHEEPRSGSLGEGAHGRPSSPYTAKAVALDHTPTPLNKWN